MDEATRCFVVTFKNLSLKYFGFGRLTRWDLDTAIGWADWVSDCSLGSIDSAQDGLDGGTWVDMKSSGLGGTCSTIVGEEEVERVDCGWGCADGRVSCGWSEFCVG
nr:hypothetical protein Itr_chr05CG12740 [Ipomoea trifida]